MSLSLSSAQTAAVTMLLQAGKTIKDIAKFAEIDAGAVTHVARSMDLEPDTEVQRRGKQLFGSAEALTYQEIAQRLAGEGFTADDNSPMHHLTVASWVKNYGWPWGGAADGDYAPDRAARAPVRSKYVLRLSKKLEAQVNADAQVAKAADSAWAELAADKTRIVQLAVIRGAAAHDVTNVVEVRKQLLEKHGENIRNAKEVDSASEQATTMGEKPQSASDGADGQVNATANSYAVDADS